MEAKFSAPAGNKATVGRPLPDSSPVPRAGPVPQPAQPHCRLRPPALRPCPHAASASRVPAVATVSLPPITWCCPCPLCLPSPRTFPPLVQPFPAGGSSVQVTVTPPAAPGAARALLSWPWSRWVGKGQRQPGLLCPRPLTPCSPSLQTRRRARMSPATPR